MATSPAHDAGIPRWQRTLMPAVLGADRPSDSGTGLRRTLRDWAVDLAMFGIALGIGGSGMIGHFHDAVPLQILDIGLGIAALSVLWVRRRHPLRVGVFTTAASTVSVLAGGAAMAGLFTTAVYCSGRRTLWVAAIAVAGDGIAPALYENHGRYDRNSLVPGLIATALVLGYGAYVRSRRELILTLHDRAVRLESEQRLRIREAQLGERARIAREMHDVLAHRISLLSVHAGALEFNPRATPEEVAAAAAVIRESAHAAQEELREVIGLLREDDAAAGQEVPSPPQPTFGDLPELIDESRRAGVSVSAQVEPGPGDVPPTMGRTVYRIVQEGLTNARRHAAADIVAVTVTQEPEGLAVAVVNRPRVGARDGEALGPGGPEGTGTGLIGLRERVALAGGTLRAGPLAAGGWEVRATLPLRPGPHEAGR